MKNLKLNKIVGGNIIAISFLFSLFLSSCEKETLDIEKSNIEMQISVNNSLSRAWDDSFENSDKIGIFAILADSDLQESGNYADNSQFSYNSSSDTWETETPIYYPLNGTRLNLYSYYPYKENPLNSNNLINLKVNEDQRDYKDYTNSDFCVAEKNNISSGVERIPLTFDHKLSQVVFTLRAGEGVNVQDLLSAELKIRNIITDATFDLSSGKAGLPESGNQLADVIPYGEWEIDANNQTSTYGLKAIIIPQELNNSTYFEIKIGSRTFNYKFNHPILLNSGESRTFAITINNIGLEINSSLNPWNYGETIYGDANEIYEINPITAFITEWEIPANTTIELPFVDNFAFKCIIDWGDGSAPIFYNSERNPGKPSYTYTNAGTYAIRINGICRGWQQTSNIYLTKILQWGDVHMTEFQSAFEGCTNLTTIPACIPNSKNYSHLFYNCSNLLYIPDSLFINSYSAINLDYAFGRCLSLTTIPEILFQSTRNMESINWLFSECFNISFIPENLFKNCSAVKYANQLFVDNRSLTNVPENLFIDFYNLKGFENVFMYCSMLESIPENLFQSFTTLEDFTGIFSNTGLREIPENLFSNCTNAKVFYNTFQSCVNLTSIPENLFQKCVNVNEFRGTFSFCANLKTIPQFLFKNNTLTTDFTLTFGYCDNLISIPENLFDYTPNVTSFIWTFMDCINLTGKTPETNGLKLWQRSGKEGYPENVHGNKCFLNCTNLTDYHDIPLIWKE